MLLLLAAFPQAVVLAMGQALLRPVWLLLAILAPKALGSSIRFRSLSRSWWRRIAFLAMAPPSWSPARAMLEQARKVHAEARTPQQREKYHRDRVRRFEGQVRQHIATYQAIEQQKADLDKKLDEATKRKDDA